MLITNKDVKSEFGDSCGNLGYLGVKAFMTWLFLFSGLFLLGYEAMAGDILQRPSLIAHFDTSIAVDEPKGFAFEKHGGSILKDGVAGGALHLGPGEYLTIDAKEIIGTIGGTVMFWVKPHWGYYDQKDGAMVSHTFASFSWADNGYFTISDGWWEPPGMYYTYFIQNNNNLVHVKSKIKFRRGQWAHIAVTWSTGFPGYVRFYVDGELVGVTSGNIKNENPMGKLFIGSDLGTFLPNKRWADSEIDELYIFKNPLSEKQIQAALLLQDPRWKEQKYDWMNKIILKRSDARQNIENNILETRAIFDEGPGAWATESKARGLIARIKRAGFNVFIPCVWHGDGTRYPSKVAPPAKYIAQGDALQTLIRVAHENGIEVHPWFTVVYRSRDFLREYYDEGTAENAFEIHRPEFRDFIVSLIQDVVRRYDVDGINLDYIRTMGAPRSDFATKAYKKRYGRDVEKDQRSFDPRGGIEPHLQEFLDDAVLDIVRRVSIGAKSMKPYLIISVDGHPTPRIMLSSDQGRQEIKWANAGLVDVVYAMDYGREPDIEGLDRASEEFRDPGKLIMLTSNYDEINGAPIPREPKVLANLVTLVKGKWGRGVGVYLYSMLTDDQISMLGQGSFKDPTKPHWWKGVR